MACKSVSGNTQVHLKEVMNSDLVNSELILTEFHHSRQVSLPQLDTFQLKF